jgi:hypothetical protein
MKKLITLCGSLVLLMLTIGLAAAEASGAPPQDFWVTVAMLPHRDMFREIGQGTNTPYRSLELLNNFNRDYEVGCNNELPMADREQALVRAKAFQRAEENNEHAPQPMKDRFARLVGEMQGLVNMWKGMDVDFASICRLPHDEFMKSLADHKLEAFLSALEKQHRVYLEALDSNLALGVRRGTLEELKHFLKSNEEQLARDKRILSHYQPFLDRLARQVAQAEVSISRAQNKVTAFWVLGGIAGVGAAYWIAKKFGWFKKEKQKSVKQVKA